MKSIIQKLTPKDCEAIVLGKQNVILSRVTTKLEYPFTVYIYCAKDKYQLYGDGQNVVADHFSLLNEKAQKGFEKTSKLSLWNGKIIGEYTCNEIHDFPFTDISSAIANRKAVKLPLTDEILLNSGISWEQAYKFSSGLQKDIYGWHVTNLIIYDQPKELNQFMIIDKDKLKACPYRRRIYTNPDYTNGVLLPGGYVCEKEAELDFCRGCADIYTPLINPPRNWCYVEGL